MYETTSVYRMWETFIHYEFTYISLLVFVGMLVVLVLFVILMRDAIRQTQQENKERLKKECRDFLNANPRGSSVQNAQTDPFTSSTPPTAL